MNSSRPLILTVEVDDSIRASLRILLQEKYDIIEANSLSKANELFKLFCPDLITLDVKLDGGNGLNFLHKLRDQGCDVPVVIISDFACIDDTGWALRLHAEDYLQKPFSPNQVKHVVEKVLSKRADLEWKHKKADGSFPKNDVSDETLIALGKASSAFIHDMATPIQALNGYAAYLKNQITTLSNKSSDLESADPLLKVCGEVEHLLKWCNQMVWEWNSLAMPFPINKQSQSAQGIMDRLKLIVKPQAETLGVAMIFEVKSDGQVYGDRLQIERVLVNLVLNALQVSAKGDPVVTIRFNSNADYSEFSVEDGGKETDPNSLRNTLNSDPFGEVTTQKRGLGLFIVNWIMERHAGRIEILGNKGSGTAVKVSFPYADKVDK